MKITINENVLKKYGLTWNEFQVLLSAYFGIDCDGECESLIKKGVIERNLFSRYPPILSDNTKNLIAKIITESDDRIQQCGIDDFEKLAEQLQEVYPDGNKAGTTYPWRGDKSEIAQKLRAIVVKYNFPFTEDEALYAVKEYVNSFKDYTHMSLLRNFILKTTKDEDDHYLMSSMFMTIIENYREKQ